MWRDDVGRLVTVLDVPYRERAVHVAADKLLALVVPGDAPHRLAAVIPVLRHPRLHVP